MTNNTRYNAPTTNERHFASNGPDKKMYFFGNVSTPLRHCAYQSPAFLCVISVVPVTPVTTANPMGSGQATVHGGEPTTSTSHRRGTNPHEVTQYDVITIKQKETPCIGRHSHPLHKGLRLLVGCEAFLLYCRIKL